MASFIAWYYYPFGLTMAGISSEAAGELKNKYKYNGIELDNDLELNLYETPLRGLDAQTGRWWQVDPLTDKMEMWSPYTSNYDNPIRYADLRGDEPCCEGFLKAAGDWLVNQTIFGLVKNTGQTIKAVAAGDKQAIGGLISYTGSKTVEGVNVFKNGTTEQKQAFVTTTSLDIAAAVVLSKVPIGEGVSSSKSTGTTLFRAVSDAEKVDMGANGVRVKAGGYETGKLFATTAQDAAQYGKSNFGLDGIPNTVVKVQVPNSVMKTATTLEADGMKAVSIPANQLPKVTPLGPLNYSPKPRNPFNITGW